MPRHCPRQKKRRFGVSETIFEGLSKEVHNELAQMTNIIAVRYGDISSHKGQRKVKIRPWWQQPGRKDVPGCLTVDVWDTEYGKRELLVTTYHTAPVAKHLARRLRENGVTVE